MVRAFCFFAFLMCETRHATVYEVPARYRGWIEIDYENAACKPLPVESAKRIVRVGANGRACTSSRYEEGWAADEFYFVGSSRTPIRVTASGGGGFVWGESYATVGDAHHPSRRYARFFVGSEDEYKHATGARE
jgi:hypothetical protein